MMLKRSELEGYVASYICEHHNKQEGFTVDAGRTPTTPDYWYDEARWAIEALTKSGNIVVPLEDSEEDSAW